MKFVFQELNEEPEPIPAIINQLKNTNNAGVEPLKESADSQDNTVIITANDNDKAIEAVTMPANEMDNEQQSLGKIKVNLI